MILEILVIVGLVGPLLGVAIGYRRPLARNVYSFVVALFPLVALAAMYGKSIFVQYGYLSFLGTSLSLSLTPLSWFFGIAISGIGVLSLVYSFSYMKDRKRLDLYYFLFLLVNGGMLGVVLSGDLITFYILWEIMSIATFMLISYNGREAVKAGLRYILFSIAGSSAMLIAIVSLYVSFGTVEIASLATALPSAAVGYALFVLLMFCLAFGIKNAVLPLHPWLPGAYAESATPFSAVLSGMLTRLGIYGFLLAMYVLIGTGMLQRFNYHGVSFSIVLAWFGAVSIVVATFIALLQHDSKRLLAWHGIGQGGYMVLGIAIGTSLGVAGGILHALNYAICTVLLFLVVGAVQYRTGGLTDLDHLGGLAKRMPITFIGGLLGVSGFIGMPLTNNFVSKWLIYKTLIMDGHALLAFAALIGTWGTILSVFKFLHNIFLGQLPQEYKDVKEVPFAMQLPMLLLGALILLFGIFPGIPLRAISLIEISFSIKAINSTLFGVPSVIGELNMINIFAAVAVFALAVYGVFALARRSRQVSQYDNYAAGSPVPVGQYQYSVRFYDQADRIIRPYLRDWADEFYCWIGRQSMAFFEQVRKVYTGNINTYALWIVLLLGVLIFMGLLGWRP
jgi:formate hydrogenlyase subunit 3/multisubunit Na+/H+ antiporter MnhD subunit